MEEIQHPKGKIYYTMGEVSEMFDVRPSLLRYWESEFDILKPHRNKKGNRLFTPQDVDNIRMIYHLLKEKKMKIEVARKYLRENRDDAGRDAEIVERLMSVRAMLLQIKQDLLHGAAEDDDDDYDEPAPVALPATDAKPAKKPARSEGAEKAAKVTAAAEGGPGSDGEDEAGEMLSAGTTLGKSAPTGHPVPDVVVLEEQFAITEEVLTVSDVIRDVEENGEKPPFEEQMLFEVVPEAEPDIDVMIEMFIAKNYDEEADEERPAVDPFAALPGGEGAGMPDSAEEQAARETPPAPYSAADQPRKEDEKPRPTVIEQTLF